MERSPYIRGKSNLPKSEQPTIEAGPKPVVLRKHQMALPISRVARIEPGRVLLMPSHDDFERDLVGQAWKAAGGQVRRLGSFWEPDAGLAQECVCLYGNLIFCQVLAQILKLDLLAPEDGILARLSPRVLGRQVSLARLEMANEFSYPCFVKSLAPKMLASGVYPSAKSLLQSSKGLEAKTGLIVSQVVDFEAEARAFIYDQKVLDCALYLGQADLAGAWELAETMAKLPEAPFGFVVDLGLKGQRWFVVEFHPAWAAGLKGCDADKVLPAIAAATLV